MLARNAKRNGVAAMRGVVKRGHGAGVSRGLRTDAGDDCPLCRVAVANAQTRAAMRDSERGKLVRFDSVAELMADLEG